MYDDFNEKLARLVVQYSVNIQPGDQVLLRGDVIAVDLVREIYREVIQAGGHILSNTLKFSAQDELFYTYATEDQLAFLNPVAVELYSRADAIISVLTQSNTNETVNIDKDKLVTHQETNKRLSEIFMERYGSGELKWNLCPYPSLAQAQEAGMGTIEYKEFVYRALALDKEDPVVHWTDFQKRQDEIIRILNQGKVMRMVGRDTDITFGIAGRKWINSCGQRNLPDGEVHSSAIEDQVNGTIRFDFPGFYLGQAIEDIYLVFKDGRVVDYDAAKGKEFLGKILAIENADRLGEIAIGTNYGVNRFTKNMLFDEKMGGTIHLALGNGYPMSGSQNKSSIHWDILKDMKQEGSIVFLDDQIIYEAGEWRI